jgi:transketolase
MTDLDARSKHLRRLIVRGLAGGGCGHIGSSMSLVEILRVLYDDVANVPSPAHPDWPDRDRIILSKGHGSLALYAILADSGFFPVEALDTCTRKGSILGGHPDTKCPGVECATGALGHGLAIGVGMALELRYQAHLKTQHLAAFLDVGVAYHPSRVFVIMGDGEIQEGSVWEAAMHAARHELSNLTVVVDYNKLQSAGPSADFVEPLWAKWEAFGFDAYCCNGHDVVALPNFLSHRNSMQPVAVICQTTKGKGLPFAENDPHWHHRPEIGPELIAKMNEALA